MKINLRYCIFVNIAEIEKNNFTSCPKAMCHMYICIDIIRHGQTRLDASPQLRITDLTSAHMKPTLSDHPLSRSILHACSSPDPLRPL